MLLVFIGAGIGGVLRFIFASLVYTYTGRSFPYGTLVINLTGSFLMGFLYVVITQHFEDFVPELTALLLVGLLGGYTTFSSFSIETFRLFEDGKILYAILNVICSTTFGILFAYFGIILGKKYFTIF